jgi:hypothetical protein
MEHSWNIETALQEIKEGLLSHDKRVIPIEEETESLNPCLLFSHGTKLMTATFLGASWKIEFPVRLKVKTGAKLYRQLLEENTLNGEGSWELGEASTASKEANLLISRHFWFPPTIETVAFIQNIPGYHKNNNGDELGGVPVASHGAYKTLKFHRLFGTFEIND